MGSAYGFGIINKHCIKHRLRRWFIEMLKITFAICGFLSLSNLTGVSNGWSLRPRWWLDEDREELVERSPTQWQLRQRFLLDLLLQVHKPLLQQELIEMGRQLNENATDYEENTWPLLLDFMERLQQGRILRPYSIYSQLQEELPQQLQGVYRFLLLAKDWQTFQRNACYARSHFNPVLFVTALQLAMEERKDTQDLMLPVMEEVLPQLYFDKHVILAALQVHWHHLVPVKISTKRSWKETLASLVYPRIIRQPVEELLMPSEPIVIQVKHQGALPAQLSLNVELNGHWSRLISRLMLLTAAANEDKSSAQLFVHNINQFVALLKLEELATGTNSLQLIDPALLTTGGVPFKATGLNAEAVQQLTMQSVEDLKKLIDKQLEKDQLTEVMCTVAQVIATQFSQLCRHLSLAINGNIVEPNLLGMATSNLRDPIYRLLLLQLAQLIAQYEDPLQMPTLKQNQLHLSKIHVGHLETFEQLVDTDLINLMDQQLLQSQRNNLRLLRRRLVARQLRLNHKPFNISLELSAQAEMTVLVRFYLMPLGKDQPRLLLDSFVSDLKMGENRLERQFPTAAKAHTLSNLYEAKQPLVAIPKACSFPQHLLLPCGTAEGLRLQLFVQLLPWNGTEIGTDCNWADSIVDWNTPVLASSLLDVVIQHQSFKLSK